MNKNIFFTSLFSVFVAFSVQAQSGWKMQPVVLETRWAKQVSPANTYNAYPRPGLERTGWINLNGLWDYAITPLSENETAFPSKADGKILVPYPLESALSGVQRPLSANENLWYKKTFQKPALKNGERLLLHFGAVDWKATVLVNGQEAGSHEGGYTAFDLDITDRVKNGSNELVVKVFDPTDAGYQPRGKQTLHPANIYYTASSGIWQTVWMEKVPGYYITSVKTTPDIDKGVLYLKVNSNTDGRQVRVSAVSQGKEIASATGKAGELIKLPIRNARLWSPEDPFLYTLKISLRGGGTQTDAVKSYFGMRKISVSKDEKGVDRIFLNNRQYYNLGVLDQGFWPDGLYTAPNDEALAFDIKAIKAMGFNTIRKHIKVEPACWYYTADKTGVLVWQDMVQPSFNPTAQAKQEFEKESKEILDQLHNYPSITTWVLFNERWGAYDQQRLTEWLKSYDPSRIVNGHTGELLYVNDQLREPSDHPYAGSDLTDVHAYPDPRMPLKQEGKAMVCGEFGGVGVSVPYHEWNDIQGWGYVQVKPKELEGRYDNMVRRLKKMKEEGLSGSIYTQPFDVEGEENGLLSYDREVIKVPVGAMREMNGSLVDLTKRDGLDKSFFLAKNIDMNDNDDRYADYIKQYEAGKKDSAFLRRLTLMAMRNKDQSGLTRFGAAYAGSLKDIWSRSNQLFIYTITRTSRDTGFALSFNRAEKVDAVIGKNAAELKVMSIIAKEEINPYADGDNAKPDWDKIEQTAVAKYGALAREAVYGHRMVYHESKNEWEQFGKYYKLYFDLAIGRSTTHVNNMTWPVVEHITDTAILNTAVRAMKYDMDHYTGDQPWAIDTYANLLYKLGKTGEALEWEKKAAVLSNNEKVYLDTMDKMKKGERTW
jgi:hypothetical protein